MLLCNNPHYAIFVNPSCKPPEYPLLLFSRKAPAVCHIEEKCCPGVEFVDIYGCAASELVHVYVSESSLISATASLCQGDSLFIADQYRKTAGVYVENYSNIYGCDSTLVTDLVVLSLPIVNLGSDISITSQQSVTLDAGDGFASYEWNTGATTQTITVDGATTGDGDHEFNVSVSNYNGCSNSDAIIVNVYTDIFENIGVTLKIYPNPVDNNKLFITSDAVDYNTYVYLYNMNGELVKNTNINSVSNNNIVEMDVTDLPAGAYILKVNVMGHERSEIIEIIK